MLAIVLRDIHQPPAPSWWPPAPGWWALAAILVAASVAMAWRRRRRMARQRRIASVFDDALAGAASPADEVARMSELLRRAARRRDAAADRLQGADWLAFLDAGADTPAFDGPLGALLLEGGFRRDVSAQEVLALRAVARRRFLDWMGGR